MATIALVPGSWLGAWAWRRVTPLLRERGHDVHPLTLTGFGDRAHLATPGTGLSVHVQDIAAALEAEELEDVVLVAHSYAGLPATGAAARLPERIAKLVYLAAVVPLPGASAFEAMPPGARESIEAAVAANDGWRIPLALDNPEFAQLYAGHGMSAEDLRWFRSHSAGHPLATYREALEPGDPRAGALPRAYIRCTADAGPSPVSAGQEGWEYREIASGHWPMVTVPRELAQLLDELARG